MTLSRTERGENFSVALKAMLDAIGDAAVDEVSFAPATHPRIFPTTWDELLASELIEQPPSGEYILTGRGWTAAVISTGQINDPAFKERIGILFAALKTLVKGRAGPATLSFRSLVTQTALPEGFVFNVIEGRYMEEIAKRRGASWVKPGRLVFVPVAFGIEPTDLRTLLHPAMIQKLEELEVKLDAARDDLSRYRCPHCDSELVASGCDPIDEYFHEQFSCGYALRDGHVLSLCPQDPNFPKFEDFELVMRQSKDGEWICWPQPKTRYAGLIDLRSYPGRTQEEAQKRVKAYYLYRAGQTHDMMAVWPVAEN